MTHYKIASEYIQFKSQLLDIQQLFLLNDTTIHKARNELKVLTLQNRSVVVKSFKVPHFLNKIVYTFFKDSKAKKSYDFSLKIAPFTPKAIAYIEFYKFGLLHESYFISEEFKYHFTIREPLLEKDFPSREAIFRAFARYTLELHNNNIFHNDYSPGNILIKEENGEFIFKIVDINRMKFSPLNQVQRAKNFSKLWADDEILKIIATEYTKHYKCDTNFIDNVLLFSHQNKQRKNFKKRIKGKKIND